MPAVVILTAYCSGRCRSPCCSRAVWCGTIRRIGSGNLGAANVLRASGVPPAVTGRAAGRSQGSGRVVVIAMRLSCRRLDGEMAGMAAIVGHVYPVWLRFRGGKGVATACGVFAVLTPLALGPAFLVFIRRSGSRGTSRWPRCSPRWRCRRSRMRWELPHRWWAWRSPPPAC